MARIGIYGRCRLYSRNKQECIKRYKNKSVVSDDRLATRLKAHTDVFM